jgi:DNA invertase Pin-like site-specific DNA recombinase
VVAVAKLDRLARDAELVLRLSREAERNGFSIVDNTFRHIWWRADTLPP